MPRVHIKSVETVMCKYSQASLKNTQELDVLYTSLLKCICIIFTNQNTQNIFYYKTLGNVTFEICSLKVTPVICYQHGTPQKDVRNQPDELLHRHHDSHGIRSGLNRQPIQQVNQRLCVSAGGPAKGFLLPTRSLWVLCPRENWAPPPFPRPRLINTEQSAFPQHSPALREPICSPKPALEAKTRPGGGSHFLSDWKQSQQVK